MTRSIACVFAHPDDETFTLGGTIARYSDAGVRCSLFCATDGNAGRSAVVTVSSPAELGALRRKELAAAAKVLGLATVELAGHGDGVLRDVDPDKLVGEIVHFFRRHRPDIVVTFGPEGAPTGHRDHRAISRAATAAFFLAGVQTAYPEQLDDLRPHAAARLYYSAWAPPPAGSPLTLHSVPATAAIDVRRFRERKQAAFLAQPSQRGSQAFFDQSLTDAEYFALASGAPQPRAIIEDLFEGL
jgi:LmbE family N-acetylglucosaminyl deacetylase